MVGEREGVYNGILPVLRKHEDSSSGIWYDDCIMIVLRVLKFHFVVYCNQY